MSPSCCTSSKVEGTNKFFSGYSAKYLKKFRKRGLAKEQRYLKEGILASSVTGKTILEIGSGIGALHLTLLNNGAASATGIDISEGMITAARELSRELGLEEKADYRNGDFAEMSGEIPDADIVILDKVVCCYEDLNHLLMKSLGKTRSVYALSFPKRNMLTRFSFLILISVGRLLRWSFQPYWHDWGGMIRRIESDGFKRTFHKNTFMWEVCVFERR